MVDHCPKSRARLRVRTHRRISRCRRRPCDVLLCCPGSNRWPAAKWIWWHEQQTEDGSSTRHQAKAISGTERERRSDFQRCGELIRPSRSTTYLRRCCAGRPQSANIERVGMDSWSHGALKIILRGLGGAKESSIPRLGMEEFYASSRELSRWRLLVWFKDVPLRSQVVLLFPDKQYRVTLSRYWTVSLQYIVTFSVCKEVISLPYWSSGRSSPTCNITDIRQFMQVLTNLSLRIVIPLIHCVCASSRAGHIQQTWIKQRTSFVIRTVSPGAADESRKCSKEV